MSNGIEPSAVRDVVSRLRSASDKLVEAQRRVRDAEATEERARRERSAQAPHGGAAGPIDSYQFGTMSTLQAARSHEGEARGELERVRGEARELLQRVRTALRDHEGDLRETQRAQGRLKQVKSDVLSGTVRAEQQEVSRLQQLERDLSRALSDSTSTVRAGQPDWVDPGDGGAPFRITQGIGDLKAGMRGGEADFGRFSIYRGAHQGMHVGAESRSKGRHGKPLRSEERGAGSPFVSRISLDAQLRSAGSVSGGRGGLERAVGDAIFKAPRPDLSKYQPSRVEHARARTQREAEVAYYYRTSQGAAQAAPASRYHYQGHADYFKRAQHKGMRGTYDR